MALLYLDTSALAKVYVRERGSELMAELTSEDADHGLAICAITQVEFHSVISRRRREGDLDNDEVKRAAERFDNHFRNVFERCPVDDRTLNLASVIVSRHVLRASDAIQLAACLTLIDDLTLSGEARGALTFVCADRRLLIAARSEGLTVLNPES